MKKRKQEKSKSYLMDIVNDFLTINIEDEIGPLKKMTKKEEEAFWAESEWTIGKIFMRIFGYGLVVILTLVGFFIIKEVLLLGIVAFSVVFKICFTYVKSDIQIIREKNRRKKLKRRIKSNDKSRKTTFTHR
jgi:hypothetical protein